jgi:hypothetical protein
VHDATQDAKDESFEESIFKTLSNERRRDILRVIGERGNATFTGIMRTAGIEDSPSPSCHTNAMKGLLVSTEGSYGLSELDQEAYNLLSTTSTHTTTTSAISSLIREISAAIVANAILWAAAILSVSTLKKEFSRSLSQASPPSGS